MIKTAQDEIARERDQAMVELRGEVVALAMAAATKIVAHNLDFETNAKLVSDFIEKLDEKKIGGLIC